MECMVWRNRRKTEERKQEVLCERKHLSILITFCSSSLNILGFVPGLFLMVSRWFQWFQTSLPHYNCVQYRNTRRDLALLLGVKIFSRNPNILSLWSYIFTLLNTLINAVRMINIGTNQSWFIFWKWRWSSPLLNIWLPTFTKSGRKNKMEREAI